ncbi:MAG: ComEC/Rec2 family competence protein [Planctomycetota bacterium]|nr:ComEC/Rec2 family competence protein [Planctomycetota bacterium]
MILSPPPPRPLVVPAKAPRTSAAGALLGLRLPAGFVALLLLSGLRAEVAEERAPPRDHAWASELVEPVPDLVLGPVLGRWHPWSARRGWIETVAHESPPLLFEIEGPPPEDGEWVALLPAAEPIPWPRGPVPGPLARDGRFRALQPVLPDELVRLAPPANHRRLGGTLSARMRPVWKRLRGGLRGRLARYEAELPAGLAPALILGDRGGLDPELADLFTRTGTRHMLAVSGLHVGLFFLFVVGPAAGALAHLLGRLLPRRCAPERATLCALLLVLYAPLAGGAPPVTRAAAAIALGLLAPRFPPGGRRVDALSLWSLALAWECLRDPTSVHTLAVQLSYLATLGILLTARPLAAALDPAGAPGRALPGLSSAGSAWWRIPIGRVGRGLRLGFFCSVAAVLATLPVVWTTFGEWSPVGLVLTPLSLPLLAAALGALWAGALLPAGLLPVPLVTWPAEALVRMIALADRLPGTPSPLPERPLPLLCLLTAAALVVLVARRRGPLWPRSLALGWGLLLLPWSAAPDGLEVHALDAGHGSAVVLRAPGLPALLFDAGSRDRPHLVSEAVAPLLARWEVRRTVVVLSHDDRDHCSGLARIVERYPPKLWMGALPARLGERLPHDCRRLDAENGRIRTRLAASLEAVCLRAFPGTGNEASRALELVFPGGRLLFCGDAEAEGLAALLAAGHLEGPTRLLLFPHHGSDTPWLGPLLARVRPVEVWISSGREPPVGRELTRRGVTWRSTWREGPLAASFLLPGEP